MDEDNLNNDYSYDAELNELRLTANGCETVMEPSPSGVMVFDAQYNAKVMETTCTSPGDEPSGALITRYFDGPNKLGGISISIYFDDQVVDYYGYVSESKNTKSKGINQPKFVKPSE